VSVKLFPGVSKPHVLRASGPHSALQNGPPSSLEPPRVEPPPRDEPLANPPIGVVGFTRVEQEARAAKRGLWAIPRQCCLLASTGRRHAVRSRDDPMSGLISIAALIEMLLLFFMLPPRVDDTGS